MPTPGLAIVAIPSDDDYVWKLSSQEVPHMTLLFLGENQATSGMVSFLEHVVKTSMHRFGMDVDYRGTLGDQEADVLFFGEYNNKMLRTWRSYLLTNEDIAKAYNSTPQFEEWKPHLTLGYPDDPAKPDKRDYSGIHWVNFDKVALWSGTFEGPEFQLKEQFPWREDISMTDEVKDILAHFGVKGMRWGVRRRPSQIHSDSASATASAKKAKKHGTKALSNKELQDLITRMNLEQQYSRVAPSGKGSKLLRGGAKFTGEVLVGVGKSQATSLVNAQATKLVASALKKK